MGEVVGGVVLVHQGEFGEGGRVTAYAADTLDRRWQREEPDPQGSAAACTGIPCVRSRTEVLVLDEATGRPGWQAGASADLRAFGPDSVLEVRDQNSPVRAVDRATGRVQAELGRWRGLFPVRGDEAYLLTHPDADRSTSVGLLRAGGTAVQPLGRIPEAAYHCQADRGAAACRVADGVALFRYRA